MQLKRGKNYQQTHNRILIIPELKICFTHNHVRKSHLINLINMNFTYDMQKKKNPISLS